MSKHNSYVTQGLTLDQIQNYLSNNIILFPSVEDKYNIELINLVYKNKLSLLPGYTLILYDKKLKKA